MLLKENLKLRVLNKSIGVFNKILIKTGLYSKPYFYYASRQIEEWRDFYRNLTDNTLLAKTSQYSQEIYQAYGTRDIQDYFEGSGVCLFQSKIVTMSYFDMRQEYLKYLYEEIDKLINSQGDIETIKVLEIGCGNCINLINLQNKYGSKLSLFGQDIADQRIANAKDYFGEKLSQVQFQVQNIVNGYEAPDNYFHIVFSMHCLEQIPYDCRSAVQEMYRLAADTVIMIEPVFELGNMTQKLYITNSDHNRMLLKTVKDLGLQIDRLEVLDIQSNPSNQSSIIVIHKT